MNKQAIDNLLKTINDSATSEGNPRTKAIVNRIVSDLFHTIEDLDVSPDEFWTALNYLGEAGQSGELGLLAAGEVESAMVRNGVRYLQRTQQKSGLWSDSRFTAPGFPRVFYLKYHGYCAYFPFWALAAYRDFTASGAAY